MIITISGVPGSGKTTVGRRLARQLHYDFYSAGDLRGMYAQQLGITIDELNKRAAKDPSSHLKADEFTEKIGETKNNFVLEGWLAWHFIPKSFKIFLMVAPDIGAKRVFHDIRGKDEPKYKTVNECKNVLAQRLETSRQQFNKLYKINFLDQKHYDLIIDTTSLTADEVVEQIKELINL